MTKTKKQLLYIDYHTYNIFKSREDKLKETIQDLLQIAEQGLGVDKVANIKEFLSNPKDYLVSEYWTLYCDNRPLHLNKANVFVNDTNIRLSALNELKKRYDNQTKELQQYKPIVNSKEVIYQVKEDDFKRYLRPERAEHYNALKAFITSAKKLKAIEKNNRDIHLIRYSSCLLFEGLDATINNSKFI